MLHTRLSFFENQPFQTHDPTQPTENKFLTQYQPSPTQPAGQPNPRTTLVHLQLLAIGTRHLLPADAAFRQTRIVDAFCC